MNYRLQISLSKIEIEKCSKCLVFKNGKTILLYLFRCILKDIFDNKGELY
jgi:hypothetical protein